MFSNKFLLFFFDRLRVLHPITTFFAVPFFFFTSPRSLRLRYFVYKRGLIVVCQMNSVFISMTPYHRRHIGLHDFVMCLFSPVTISRNCTQKLKKNIYNIDTKKYALSLQYTCVVQIKIRDFTKFIKLFIETRWQK